MIDLARPPFLISPLPSGPFSAREKH